jgi:hypothetical protein
MATKKQKHAAALARREAFLKEEAEIGRQAIEVAAKRREIENRNAWKQGHEKHYKFVDECPHCSDIKREQAEKARIAAIEKVAAAAKQRDRRKPTKVLDTPPDGILPGSEQYHQGDNTPIDLSRIPKAEIEGVDVFNPFAKAMA